jgi:hypothetical protein
MDWALAVKVRQIRAANRVRRLSIGVPQNLFGGSLA